jgi:hypothetical protein
MTQVLLPEGLAIQIGIKHQTTEDSNSVLPALIGRQGKEDERVNPGPHSYNGSYTDLKLQSKVAMDGLAGFQRSCEAALCHDPLQSYRQLLCQPQDFLTELNPSAASCGAIERKEEHPSRTDKIGMTTDESSMRAAHPRER